MPDLSGVALMSTCWRRPYYFERTLASWAAADGINEIRRFVIALGATDRVTQQMALIQRMRPRFACPVDVEFQSERALKSLSASRAIAEAITGIFDDPEVDFVIAGEEDIVVSSDVLAYMGWAREKFAGDESVLAVVAHNQLGQGWDGLQEGAVPQDADAEQDVVRLVPYFSPWVWGTWRDRWETVLEPTWDYDLTSGSRGWDNGYDWQIQDRVLPQRNMVCVVPDASRSQNIGEHEAVFAHPADFPRTQALSFREKRSDVAYRLVSE
jgi:hypothetical protein